MLSTICSIFERRHTNRNTKRIGSAQFPAVTPVKVSGSVVIIANITFFSCVLRHIWLRLFIMKITAHYASIQSLRALLCLRKAHSAGNVNKNTMT